MRIAAIANYCLCSWFYAIAHGGAVISPIITGDDHSQSPGAPNESPAKDLLALSRGQQTSDGADAESDAELTTDDIIRPIKPSRHPGLKAFVETAQTWPGGLVPYEIDKALKADHRARRIRQAMDTIEAHVACVKFVPRTSAQQSDYVWFFDAGPKRCFSYVGRVGGLQELSVGKGCENKLGVIIHEILHTLGIVHEQSRPDRDDYVAIQWDNIHEKRRPNFYKYSSAELDTLGVPYDYGSLMHYHASAFTANGMDTIVTAEKRAQSIIGQRVGMSACDIVKVLRLYGCPPTGKQPLCQDGDTATTYAPTSTRAPSTTAASTTPTGGGSKCVDDYAGCEDIKYDLGACDRFPGLYRRLCPRICGLCDEEGGAACADSPYYLSMCERIASGKGRERMCADQFLVRAVCPLTCGLCSGSPHLDTFHLRRTERQGGEKADKGAAGRLFTAN